MRTVFTIGHSTQEQECFIRLLLRHEISAVCDVRSKPYSRFTPQFNREALKLGLRNQGIAYAFLGEELGARSEDRSCYRDGIVQYERLAHTTGFQRGLQRVFDGAVNGHRMALMCAEKEPLECHRTILVSRYLIGRGLDVQHIHEDGELETHAAAMGRLLRLLRLPEEDLFRTPADVLEDAYLLQERRIAYEWDAGAAATKTATV